VLLAFATNTDYLLKAVRTIYLKGHVTAFLDDYHEFDNRTIGAGPVKYSWPKHGLYNTTSAPDRLEKKHQEMGTIAFVVIKNDSVFTSNIIRAIQTARTRILFQWSKVWSQVCSVNPS